MRARATRTVVLLLVALPWFAAVCASARAQDSEPLAVQKQWDAVMGWDVGDKESPPTPSSGARGKRAQAPAAKAGNATKGGQAKKGGRSSGSATKGGKARTSRGANAGVSASYLALREQWHAPAPESLRKESGATLVPALVFHVVGEQTPFVLIPNGEQGGFGPDQLATAKAAFRSGDGGPEVSERLLDLIYRATRYFDVPYVHLISGVRKDRGASRHTHGLAADIVLPGVDDEDLAAYFRAQGFVGVGVYTKSGFVHIDVREKSFFWIDPSPPGKRLPIRPVRADEARAADEAALARGGAPMINPPRLTRALEQRNALRRKQRARKAAAQGGEAVAGAGGAARRGQAGEGAKSRAQRAAPSAGADAAGAVSALADSSSAPAASRSQKPRAGQGPEKRRPAKKTPPPDQPAALPGG